MLIQYPTPTNLNAILQTRSTSFVEGVADWQFYFNSGVITQATVSGTTDSKVMQFVMDDVSTSFGAVTWLNTSAVNSEISAKMRQSAGASQGTMGIVSRVSGTNSSKEGYLVRVRSNALVVEKMSGTTAVAVNTAYGSYPSTISFPITLGNWYWFKSKTIDNIIYGKAWNDGDAEPAGWMIAVSDSTFSGAGESGLTIINRGFEFQCDNFTFTPIVGGQTQTVVYNVLSSGHDGYTYTSAGLTPFITGVSDISTGNISATKENYNSFAVLSPPTGFSVNSPTVTKAEVVITPNGGGGFAKPMKIAVQLVDDAVPPISKSDLDGRVRSTFVLYDGDQWIVDVEHRIDIKSLVQSIYNRTGYVNGKIIVFWQPQTATYNSTDGNTFNTAYAWDGDPTKSIRLEVTYTT